jgi:alpha-beta hydrolase superfamily lysophospholipase
MTPDLGVVDLGVDNISRDPAVVAAYRADPLVHHGKVRARTGAETLLAVERVSRRMPSLTLPVLVMHGGEDRIADPRGARQVVEAVGSPDTTLRIYEGLFHEIFNEPEQKVVLDELVAWFDAHRERPRR